MVLQHHVTKEINSIYTRGVAYKPYCSISHEQKNHHYQKVYTAATGTETYLGVSNTEMAQHDKFLLGKGQSVTSTKTTWHCSTLELTMFY